MEPDYFDMAQEDRLSGSSGYEFPEDYCEDSFYDEEWEDSDE